jgi:DNA-binding transcriptional LysR family regulator
MDLIDGMRTYVAAVEAGSFTAAADRLGMSKKLVSKYIGQLEDHLKARLLHRTTRRLSPTEAGQQYYSGCLLLLADLDALEGGLAAQQTGLTGVLRVTAPMDFGMQEVLPAIETFQASHPDVTIDLHLADRYVDLAAEGFDLAIRIGDFDDSALITRKLGTVAVWIVAAPALLETIRLDRPQDLSRAPCLQDTNARNSHLWQITGDDGSKRVQIHARTKVNSALAMRRLALSGRGVALCPDVFVKEDVRAGRLVRLFPGHQTRKADIRVVYLSSARMPARQRAFIEHLVRFFSRVVPD